MTTMKVCYHQYYALSYPGMYSRYLNYRSRATTGRFQLVAAPLRFQAKIVIMCFLCGNLMAKNAIFELWPRPVAGK